VRCGRSWLLSVRVDLAQRVDEPVAVADLVIMGGDRPDPS
jgi:hypothetical protein